MCAVDKGKEAVKQAECSGCRQRPNGVDDTPGYGLGSVGWREATNNYPAQS